MNKYLLEAEALLDIVKLAKTDPNLADQLLEQLDSDELSLDELGQEFDEDDEDDELSLDELGQEFDEDDEDDYGK